MSVLEEIQEEVFCAPNRDMALIRIGNMLAGLGNPEVDVDEILKIVDEVFN